MFTEHGVIGLFREPHANILSVGITPILPLIGMEGEDLQSPQLLQGYWVYLNKDNLAWCQVQERLRSIFIPKFPGDTKGWDHSGALYWPQLWLGDLYQALWKHWAWAIPVSNPQLYTVCHLCLENSLGFASSETFISSTEAVTPMAQVSKLTLFIHPQTHCSFWERKWN